MDQDEPAARRVTAVGRDDRGLDHRRHGGHDAGEHARDVIGTGQRLRQAEQRRGGSGRLALLLQEARVLVGDRSVRGEHLQHALVLLVELVDPEMREHDDAGHALADLERHREQRLVDLVGALDLVAVRIVQRVGRVVRLGR